VSSSLLPASLEFLHGYSESEKGDFVKPEDPVESLLKRRCPGGCSEPPVWSLDDVGHPVEDLRRSSDFIAPPGLQTGAVIADNDPFRMTAQGCDGPDEPYLFSTGL